jgi:hypothetical protein
VRLTAGLELRGPPMATAPQLTAPLTSDAAPSSWEKPRGPHPLSLFGAGDDQEVDRRDRR